MFFGVVQGQPLEAQGYAIEAKGYEMIGDKLFSRIIIDILQPSGITPE